MKTNGYYEQEYASKREVIDIATEIVTEIVNDANEIEGKVLTFANLPLANQHTDKIWLVEQSSGVWLVNYKQAGLYKSDGTTWNLLDSTSDIINTLNNKADKLTTITTGNGLAGGGDLSANRTISHSDTSTQANVVNSGGNVLQSANLDDFGHITSFTSTDLDARYVLLSGAYANPTWITSLDANKLTGTIPSNVLGASTVYIGTTAIALNRASGNQALTGISSVQYVGATSGGATLQSPAVAGTTTFTLPTTSGNLIGTGDTETVSGNMLANSGVVAGTYQSATTINPLTIDAKGRVTNVGTNVAINDTTKLPLTGGTLTGALISTRANNTGTGLGQIYLNGATSNRIDFNQNGVSDPAFTTRSIGTKIVLFPFISASTVDYALGISSSTLWYSVPTVTAQHRFFTSTTSVARITNYGMQIIANLYEGNAAFTALNTTSTLTIAQILTLVIESTPTANITFTLPTGTNTDAGVMVSLETFASFTWSIVNRATGFTITMAGNTGNTYIGNTTIAANNSATFRTQKTAANTFKTVRI